MSDVVRVPARLRMESAKEDAWAALQRRFGGALLLVAYENNQMTEVAVLEQGAPRALTVEDQEELK